MYFPDICSSNPFMRYWMGMRWLNVLKCFRLQIYACCILWCSGAQRQLGIDINWKRNAIHTFWVFYSLNKQYKGRIKELQRSYTEREMSSFWWNFHHWLHWKLSFCELPVQSVTKIPSKWQYFCFSVYYQLISKPDNKAAAAAWPDPYVCALLAEMDTTLLAWTGFSKISIEK